ncbi:hypothetical protein MUK70_09140 [Dyadobacter chenwenxiniae]|uniref:Uncharacterized protein n=1 Tax=Dyadobacter chenwenxiniae TaxID=2906456 RepID=A0A9X1TGC7_9BACT|nr:hypothetical protein [Dyadobacter chenwenxiniae]MCF0051944.1 hypothetical protein [Dyadobacter chenwenxiniae]MCF0063475.1 hypothetical protein [Dyadobacter chenwenxiniae]UON85146.1 hypothetical protein MUK70_09140 [Dyadobacter chenwenxiniae]
MKNHIECHYKDGALVFCTTHGYSYSRAHEILDVFNVLGLVSKLRNKSSDLFWVVGRLHVDYDPFQHEPEKWNQVVSELVRNKTFLEEKLEAF